FVWNVRSILEAFEKFQPEMYQLFQAGYSTFNTSEEKQFITENYSKAENISIDYAVMEKADNVFILPATFDWNDLGTWGSLYDKLPKDECDNAMVNGNLFVENATNNIIRTNPNKLVVIGGLDDFIIVDKDDVLLIYPKKREQEIKQIVAKMNAKKSE
ncbi:MAG: mannose-1-phosphate guanylyltransferase, partial [Myroides sp.]